ncbi:MAG: lysophospholipid acyltransferase family protein [Bacteroidales bacterium]
MIPARHTWFHVRFFRLYADLRIRRHFSRVVIHPPVPELPDKPLLVIGNHFSWWDGFFILWLNNRLFHRRFYVMMLEEQLKNNMILNRTGAFSIRPGSRDAVASIRYARDILTRGVDPALQPAQRPLLLIYPQGAIRSMHDRHLHFESGLGHILDQLQGQVTLLMSVALTDYFSNQKPELHFYLREYPLDDNLNIEHLENEYNDFLKYARREQMPVSDQ